MAYAVAGVIGMIPATLTYRLASYWVPLYAGPIACGAFWLRYRRRRSPTGTSAA